MEAAILDARSPPPAAEPAVKKAREPASMPKPRCAAAARRKTLGDITNLRRRAPDEEPDESTCAAADGAEGDVGQLVKENADLVKLLEERDDIIQLSGTEIEKLRLANWELARANSQMMAELNLGRNKLKALQHELACSRATLKAKTSELEDAKKAMKRRNAHPQHLGSDISAQIKDDGGVVDPEPASGASHAGSIQMPRNASRKRMLRSRSLGPVASTKLALPKEKETAQRRKSMRIPQPSDRKDLFELEGVQLAIGSCNIDPKSASGSERPGQAPAQFLRRSSLGRPLRQARERVSTYKEVPLNIKLRRS
ncbi:shugoshin-1-like [Phragmites australis]|uniref:shugoshin-1-like n=1 Tax=Phragmites australis TaxID=29695 RepID=UPI002D777A28|nr:shugoshin-1-like [Phragmites australis]